MRLPDELLAGTAPDLVLCDYRSVAGANARNRKALEAITRKIYTANPAARIIAPIIPAPDGVDPTQIGDLTADDILDNALAAYYGVHLVDLRQAEIDLIALGNPITDYIGGGTHQTVAGHAIASGLEVALLQSLGIYTAESHGTLPAPLYDTDGYYTDTTPQRILGNANDGTTGTWTTTGTRIESSEAGATATFVVTCRSFGLYSAGTANTVCDVQVDGGAWLENVTVNHNGQYFDDLSDAEHTIVVRVRTGVAIRIDEFWAI